MSDAYLSIIVGLLFLIVAVLVKPQGADESFIGALLTGMSVFFIVGFAKFVKDRK